MDTVENILRRHQWISDRFDAGTYPKGFAFAAIKACDSALKAIEAGATIRRVKELEAECESLRKQLAGRRVA